MLAAFKHIQCFVFDVDGVLTNGTLLVMPGGLMARTMNIKDGYAIQLAIKKGYKIWVISGGNSEEVKERLNRLGVEEVYMKVSDKAELLKELAILNKIELANILYIFQSKLNIVTSALNQSKLLSDPLEILAKYGGFEIAALVGFIIRAATLKVPIILDGVITLAAAVAANKIRPGISKNLIAGHCSAEPASAIAIKHLGLEPILDLDLRLGEGTGAVLAIPIIRAACKITKNMGELKDYL